MTSSRSRVATFGNRRNISILGTVVRALQPSKATPDVVSGREWKAKQDSETKPKSGSFSQIVRLLLKSLQVLKIQYIVHSLMNRYQTQ